MSLVRLRGPRLLLDGLCGPIGLVIFDVWSGIRETGADCDLLLSLGRVPVPEIRESETT